MLSRKQWHHFGEVRRVLPSLYIPFQVTNVSIALLFSATSNVMIVAKVFHYIGWHLIIPVLEYIKSNFTLWGCWKGKVISRVRHPRFGKQSFSFSRGSLLAGSLFLSVAIRGFSSLRSIVPPNAQLIAPLPRLSPFPFDPTLFRSPCNRCRLPTSFLLPGSMPSSAHSLPSQGPLSPSHWCRHSDFQDSLIFSLADRLTLQRYETVPLSCGQNLLFQVGSWRRRY
jgi:hypothetical protein